MQIIKYVPRASGDEPPATQPVDVNCQCAPRQRG